MINLRVELYSSVQYNSSRNGTLLISHAFYLDAIDHECVQLVNISISLILIM